jgi:two-component system, LytTR family, response regulator
MDQPAIRTLVVDDEPIARRLLREELDRWPEIMIVGEASDGHEALQKIGQLKPHMVFLDLQMPVLSGFEVVHELNADSLPVIIVVTAYDEHAIQAFEAGAVDYLLKPVSEERLKKAIDRAKRLLERPVEVEQQIAKIAAVSTPSHPSRERKVIGRNGDDYVLLDSNEVLAFQAERELVWIITARHRLLANQSLRAIEQRLAQTQFQRVHRNALVNLNHVRKLKALSSQRWCLTLSNALEIVVSKREARRIREILRW